MKSNQLRPSGARGARNACTGSAAIGGRSYRTQLCGRNASSYRCNTLLESLSSTPVQTFKRSQENLFTKPICLQPEYPILRSWLAQISAIQQCYRLPGTSQRTSVNGEKAQPTASIQPRHELTQHVERLTHIFGVGSVRTQLQICAQIACSAEIFFQIESDQCALPQKIRAQRRNRQ
jgi:hypothetical protein